MITAIFPYEDFFYSATFPTAKTPTAKFPHVQSRCEISHGENSCIEISSYSGELCALAHISGLW